MTDYGVVPTGFSRKSLPVILSEIEEAAVAVFGAGVIQTAQSPLGQLNGLFANLASQLWEMAEDTYQSYDPDQAEGVRLEMLARLRLLGRDVDETDEDFRQAITNNGRARVDLQDLRRAVSAISGVTFVAVFVNDGDDVDADGLDGHSVAVAVIGGDSETIALAIREYVVPGIGTVGNVRVDAEIDGVCRSINLARPSPVRIRLEIEVVRRADRLGCPPAALTSIAEALVAAMQGDRRPINGEDVSTFMIRSAIEAAFPNVEVTSIEGARGAGSIGAMPISIGFYEIASFDIEDITVTNAP